jgi:hypothetical protein
MISILYLLLYRHQSIRNCLGTKIIIFLINLNIDLPATTKNVAANARKPRRKPILKNSENTVRQSRAMKAQIQKKWISATNLFDDLIQNTKNL